MKPSLFTLTKDAILLALCVLAGTAVNPARAADASRNEAVDPAKPAQFVYVSGEVTIPQRCLYTNGMTLGASLKMARGVTAFASPQVTLTREGKPPMTFNRQTLEQGKAADIELLPGDKVFVPRK